MDEMTQFISVDEIQKTILPMNKKTIRRFLHQYLPVKKIGRQLYVNRAELIQLLSDADRELFPLREE